MLRAPEPRASRLQGRKIDGDWQVDRASVDLERERLDAVRPNRLAGRVLPSGGVSQPRVLRAGREPGALRALPAEELWRELADQRRLLMEIQVKLFRVSRKIDELVVAR